jgi:hypothetical protein
MNTSSSGDNLLTGEESADAVCVAKAIDGQAMPHAFWA